MGDEEEEASMGATRYPVMPSLVSLQTMRNRLHLAYLGKKLMKWTALATGKELRKLSMEMAIAMKDYGIKMQEAFILLARARYFVPGLNETVIESLTDQACITVTSTKRSVSGVKVSDLHVIEVGCDSYQYVGMSRGGTAVKECKIAWLNLVKLMVLLCQYRATFELIDIANKNATKKQNVLSRCIIPRIIITMRYILSELDEIEREESFRLKRFKQLKYKNVQPKPKELEPVYEEEPKMPEPKPEPKVEPKPEPKVQIKPIPEPIPIPVIPEPPKLDQLQLLISHINEVVRLAEHLKNEPKSQGIAVCDLAWLKNELKKFIEISENPNKDVCGTCTGMGRSESSCSCKKMLKALEPNFIETPKPEGFEAALQLLPKFNAKIDIPEYILKPQPLEDKNPPPPPLTENPPPPPLTASPDPLDLQAMSNYRIEQLENHVDDIIRTTNHYQCEGLLSKSAEDFLKCCKSVKVKIKEFKSQKIIREKLDRLKEQVTHLEKVTSFVRKTDLSATTVSSFVSCCKEFKAKLDFLKSCRGPPSVLSIEKLLNRIDYSIVLSKEAKEKGLVSESVEEFIKSCVEIKSKIEPQKVTRPQVIGDLLSNLNDMLDFIKKYKDGALISDSIEKFYNHCQTTKAKLEGYKVCPKSVCENCNRPTSPPKSVSCSSAKASSHALSGNSCSAGTSVPSSQSSKTTCSHRVEKQQSTQDSDTLCTEITCIHKKPSTRSCKSNTTVPPEKSESVESGCNLCSVRSKSNSAVKFIVVPKEGKKMNPKLEIIESKTTTVRRYKEADGSIVEEKKIVIVKGRVNDSLRKKPSKTSSYGSCGSSKSTKRINLCKVPVTKGFKQPVRNIKSETLIRSLDLSNSYPPFLWSSVSDNMMVSPESSHENKTDDSDPFFCTSSTTGDDDSVLLMC